MIWWRNFEKKYGGSTGTALGALLGIIGVALTIVFGMVGVCLAIQSDQPSYICQVVDLALTEAGIKSSSIAHPIVHPERTSLSIHSSANPSSSKDLARLLGQSLDNIGFPIAPDLATDNGPSVEITAIAIDGPHQPSYPNWSSTVTAHIVVKRDNSIILSQDFPATSTVDSSAKATDAALIQVVNKIAQYLYDHRQALNLQLR